MKTGNPKQAIGLGVVALIAIGILGKTAFGAFGGENASRPLVVQELRGPETGLPAKSAPSPTVGTNVSTSKTDANTNTEYQGPTYVVRDAFAKPPMRTQSFPGTDRGDLQGKGPNFSQFNNEAIPPVDPDFLPHTDPPVDTKANKEGPKNDTKKPEQPKENPVAQIKVKIRFDGFVDAGSPTAIVSIDGKNFNIGIGEILLNGYKVSAISSDKITVQKNKETKTIYIGRETEF